MALHERQNLPNRRNFPLTASVSWLADPYDGTALVLVTVGDLCQPHVRNEIVGVPGRRGRGHFNRSRAVSPPHLDE